MPILQCFKSRNRLSWRSIIFRELNIFIHRSIFSLLLEDMTFETRIIGFIWIALINRIINSHPSCNQPTKIYPVFSTASDRIFVLASKQEGKERVREGWRRGYTNKLEYFRDNRHNNLMEDWACLAANINYDPIIIQHTYWEVCLSGLLEFRQACLLKEHDIHLHWTVSTRL